MGSCVSSQSSVTLPPSPVKEKVINGDRPTNGLVLKPRWSPSQSTRSFKDYGSEEETFFDSQPWLESDSEDFFSVNGDFTPSRGNTPIHRSFMGTPRVYATPEAKTPGSMPEPSPNTKRKKLAELFRDSIGGHEDIADLEVSAVRNILTENLEAKPTFGSLPTSTQGTPRVSRATSANGSERTPYSIQLAEQEKAVGRLRQCCLPSVVSYRGFRERKKTRSPVIAVRE